MNINDLPTPCLILDKNKIQKNIDSLHQHLNKLGVSLRPHGKTAKSIDVMNMVLPNQQGGITVSTLKEAEYYFENGIDDIVYAVGIVPQKCLRIAELMNRGAKITLVLDSIVQAELLIVQAEELAVCFAVLIEIDCDGHRSGINDDVLLLQLAQLISSSTKLDFKGVLTHAGESYNCKSIDEIRAIAKIERDTAVHSAQLLRDNNIPCTVVSVGSTPTAVFAEDLTGVTEVRAGVFVFYDLVMLSLAVCDINDIGISLLTTVIGHQKNKGWVITDGGWMSLSRDKGTPNQAINYGYGAVCDQQGNPFTNVVVSSANQEHGIIENNKESIKDFSEFEVGTLLRILPNHACATSAMHDHYHIVEEDEVIDCWQRINGW